MVSRKAIAQKRSLVLQASSGPCSAEVSVLNYKMIELAVTCIQMYAPHREV
jgi:hypothetical protein